VLARRKETGSLRPLELLGSRPAQKSLDTDILAETGIRITSDKKESLQLEAATVGDDEGNWREG
jgi:hypothetical protein